MKSIERVLATLQGTETDRRAVILTLSLYGARLTNCPLSKYYTDPESYVKGQNAVYKQFEPDVLFAPFELPLLGAAFGSVIKIFDNQPPNIIKPIIDSADEFTSLSIPDVDSEPGLTYIRDCLRSMAKQFSPDVPVAAIALSPLDLPVLIMGIDSWLETLLFQKQLAIKILKICIDHFIQWTDALFRDGATFVVLPISFANMRIITPKIANEIAIPYLTEAFSKVKGPLVLHHVGTSILGSLEILKTLPNVAGFCVGKEDKLSKAREIIGPGPVLLGNIDGPGLLGREPSGIFKQVTAMLDGRKDDPNYIVATSAADIDLETPIENIQAIVDAVRAYGNGGLNDS